MGSNPYSVTITKTLVVDMIPHQQPALMGTATVQPSGLVFDFSVEQLPGQSDANIELNPNFDTTRYFVPDMVTELRASPTASLLQCLLTSIKTYYNTFLSTLK